MTADRPPGGAILRRRAPSTMKTVQGRVAIVTGATGRGIGRSTCLTLAREGAR